MCRPRVSKDTLVRACRLGVTTSRIRLNAKLRSATKNPWASSRGWWEERCRCFVLRRARTTRVWSRARIRLAWVHQAAESGPVGSKRALGVGYRRASAAEGRTSVARVVQ